MLLVGAACGRIDFDLLDDSPSPEELDGYASGTRLKLMWDEYEDGTRHYASVYDSVLDEVCLPIAWSDGVTRCSPSGDLTYYFLDAACTQPVAAIAPGRAVPIYTYELDWCRDSVPRLFSVGAAFVPAAVYTATPSSCSGPISSPGWTYHAVTEVPADRYVTLSSTLTGSSPLALRSYVADDGFVLPASFRDARLGDCVPSIYEPSLSCKPRTTGGNVFSDAACTEPVSLGNCPTPQAPYFGVGDCAPAVRPIEAEYTGPIWSGSPSMCTSFTLAPPRHAFTLGTPIALEPLARELGMQADRRMQHIYDVSGPARLRRDALYDSTLDTECGPRAATDGTQRCLPSTAAVSTDYFSDPACTVPLRIVGGFELCGVVTVPRLALEYSPTTSAYGVVEVGAEYVGPRYRAGSTCVAETGSTVRYFTASPSLDIELFAQSTLITDP